MTSSNELRDAIMTNKKKNKHKAGVQKNVSEKPKSAVTTFRAINNSLFVFILIVAMVMAFCFEIHLNFKQNFPKSVQLKYLNPDAKVYYNIAENMTKGAGFIETHRNKISLPSVGHPALLSIFCVIGGLKPAEFSWLFFFLSAILLGIAIRIYCKNNIIVLLGMLFYCGFLAYFKWLSANVESSIIFANVAIAAGLALFYRHKFKYKSAIGLGILIAFNLLIRPLFLYPVHLAFIIFVLFSGFHYIRHRDFEIAPFIKGWLTALLVTEIIIFATLGYSHAKYNDSRLVTGTYGALALLPANSIHVPIDRPYSTRVKYSPEYMKIFTLIPDVPGMTWQKRHDIAMNECVKYVKQNPRRAIKGWWWRFRQFLGIYSGNFSWKKPLTVIHSSSVIAIITLCIIKLILALKSKQLKISLMNSASIILASLFFLYAAIHSVFVYAEFRYVMATVPFLTAAIAFLIFEIANPFSENRTT